MMIPQSFTLKAKGKLSSIRSTCHVAVASRPQQVGDVWLNVTALWDTGATKTCISKELVKTLNLQPVGKMMSHHADGVSEVNTYLVNIQLPNNILFPALYVCEAVLSGFEVLIGMDIITNGDFSITNVNNETCFSFRIPSVKVIDYVQEAHTPVIAQAKPNRNGLCPCGSKKKYKQCCGKGAA